MTAGVDAKRPARPTNVEPGTADVAQRDLVVTGMTCASCVASVEDALRGVAGVRGADVNLATERARVEVDPARTDDAALVRAIERAGYGALVLASDRADRAAMEQRERALRVTYLRALRRSPPDVPPAGAPDLGDRLVERRLRILEPAADLALVAQ